MKKELIITDAVLMQTKNANLLPLSMVRSFDELDGEEELYGANQEAAEVEDEGESAQDQGHVVDRGELFRAYETVRGQRHRGHPDEEGQRDQGQKQGDQTQQTETRQDFLESGLQGSGLLVPHRGRRPGRVQGRNTGLPTRGGSGGRGRRQGGYRGGNHGGRTRHGRGRGRRLTGKPRGHPGDVEAAVGLVMPLMLLLARHREVVVSHAAALGRVVSQVGTDHRADAVHRVLRGRQGRQVQGAVVARVQPLGQVVDAQLGVVEHRLELVVRVVVVMVKPVTRLVLGPGSLAQDDTGVVVHVGAALGPLLGGGTRQHGRSPGVRLGRLVLEARATAAAAPALGSWLRMLQVVVMVMVVQPGARR